MAFGLFKRCTACGERKPRASFNFTNKVKGYVMPECRPCHAKRDAACRAANIEARRAYDTMRYGRDKAKRLAAAAAYREANREKVNATVKRWQGQNLERLTFHNRVRVQHISKRARVVWGNSFFISEIYALARLRTKVTGIVWHVDHRVPLKSDLVCGLHNEFNLAVIPATINREKKNRRWPDMP